MCIFRLPAFIPSWSHPIKGVGVEWGDLPPTPFFSCFLSYDRPSHPPGLGFTLPRHFSQGQTGRGTDRGTKDPFPTRPSSSRTPVSTPNRDLSWPSRHPPSVRTQGATGRGKRRRSTRVWTTNQNFGPGGEADDVTTFEVKCSVGVGV